MTNPLLDFSGLPRFDAIRPEQALWRMNWLTYDDPSLFQPAISNSPQPATRQ